MRIIIFEVNLIWLLSYRNTPDLFRQHLLWAGGSFANEALNYSKVSLPHIWAEWLSISCLYCFEECSPNSLYLRLKNESDSFYSESSMTLVQANVQKRSYFWATPLSLRDIVNPCSEFTQLFVSPIPSFLKPFFFFSSLILSVFLYFIFFAHQLLEWSYLLHVVRTALLY